MRYLQISQTWKRRPAAEAELRFVLAVGGEVIELPNGQFTVRVPIPKAATERHVRQQLARHALEEIDIPEDDFLEVK